MHHLNLKMHKNTFSAWLQQTRWGAYNTPILAQFIGVEWQGTRTGEGMEGGGEKKEETVPSGYVTGQMQTLLDVFIHVTSLRF